MRWSNTFKEDGRDAVVDIIASMRQALRHENHS